MTRDMQGAGVTNVYAIQQVHMFPTITNSEMLPRCTFSNELCRRHPVNLGTYLLKIQVPSLKLVYICGVQVDVSARHPSHRRNWKLYMFCSCWSYTVNGIGRGTGPRLRIIRALTSLLVCAVW